MKDWVKKLANKLQNDGTLWQLSIFSPPAFKIDNFEFILQTTAIIIRNDATKSSSCFEIDQEEYNLLKESLKKCEKRTSDSLIEQLNHLL